jgi:hypothetical protein
MKNNTGIGATKELSLRVSVATLVRVLFDNPSNGTLMLALERKATLLEGENGRIVEVKSQPFGGAIRIRDLGTLRDLISDFRFDSERSRSERDFRIFIRPSDWEAVREFCTQHLTQVGAPILETDPTRELAEELADALKISLEPDQYIHKPVATVIEDNPIPTENIHAEGSLTARVYRVFEATISDPSLALAMITNSESFSDEDLQELVWRDAQNGGKGRANAILALPMKHISSYYLALSPKERNVPVLFEKDRLDETVAAVLEGIPVPKYQRLIEDQ